MYCKVALDIPLDRYFDYAVPEHLSSQVAPGIRVTVPFGRTQMTGVIVTISQETTLQEGVVIKDILSVLDEKPLFGSDLFPLATFIQQTWGGAIGQILFALLPSQDHFKLQESELIPLPPLTPGYKLNEHQETILAQLKTDLQNGFKRVLLNGIDTAAHTEIAVRLAHEVLQNYGQVLLTFSDVIAAQRFAQPLQERLGKENVWCWHSKMLLSQKKIIYSRISNGLPCVVVSVRAGGVLPFKNLRLAVILEEDSDNYKQKENGPLFHLRDLMAFRCKQHEALLLHCSDTPSLEILHAVKNGEVEQINTTQTPASLPIQITTKKGKRSSLFSDLLLNAIARNLQEKHASLLVLNRRGYANTYYCFNCGAYAKCKKCGAILSQEKTEEYGDYLLCRKCGHKETLTQICPKCQNKIFKSRGGGTQKLVTEISSIFPSARVLRLDSDTLRYKDGQGYQVCQALDKAEADIVVGTRQALEAAQSDQIRLAALVDADLELDTPDFRASERFGQLIYKLKNKLATRPGSVLFIQTSSLDLYHFALLRGPYEVCAQEELAARERFVYPPYVQLVKVLIKAKEPALLEAETIRLANAGRLFATEVLGPVKSGKLTDKLHKQYILFKATPQQYPELIRTLGNLSPSKKTEFIMTADPYDFY